MTQETKSSTEQMDVRALADELGYWAVYGTMPKWRRDLLEEAVAALRQPAVSAGEPSARDEMLKTAAELRATSNGNCDAIRQAILWEQKAAALPPSNPPDDWKAICDSYAEENQRLSDQLEAANAKLANPPGAEPVEQVVQRIKEACAEVADRAVERETAIIQAAAQDAALSVTGREGIEDRALARKRLAEDMATSIRALIPAASPPSDVPEKVIEVWRAIETAPKDTSVIVVTDTDIVGEAKLHDDGNWYWAGGDSSDYHDTQCRYPRLWQPLPDAPLASPKDAAATDGVRLSAQERECPTASSPAGSTPAQRPGE